MAKSLPSTAVPQERGEAEAVHEDYIAFNPKQPMRLYEEDTVTVSAGRSLPLVQQKATVPNLPPPEISKFEHSGRLLEVELTGDGFRIEPSSKASVQDIDDPSEPAVWKWFVTPQKPGKHDLVLSICFQSKVNGIDVSKCDPSQQRQIEVDVAGVLPALKYAATEYTWAAALVPAGTIGAVATGIWSRLKRRKKTGGGSPGGPTAPLLG